MLLFSNLDRVQSNSFKLNVNSLLLLDYRTISRCYSYSYSHTHTRYRIGIRILILILILDSDSHQSFSRFSYILYFSILRIFLFVLFILLGC